MSLREVETSESAVRQVGRSSRLPKPAFLTFPQPDELNYPLASTRQLIAFPRGVIVEKDNRIASFSLSVAATNNTGRKTSKRDVKDDI